MINLDETNLKNKESSFVCNFTFFEWVFKNKNTKQITIIDQDKIKIKYLRGEIIENTPNKNNRNINNRKFPENIYLPNLL